MILASYLYFSELNIDLGFLVVFSELSRDLGSLVVFF